MKNTGLLFVVVLVAAVTVWKVSRQKGKVNELLVSNIEALAAGEDGWYDAYCHGNGNVNCYDGTKVACFVKIYKLE